MTLKFKRVLLKVSGEALMGNQSYGQDLATIDRIASEIKTVHALGAQVSLVVGGGNIFRGISAAAAGMERASADYMGMLATVMNALALQNALERIGISTRVLSAIPMMTVCEPYIRRRHPPLAILPDKRKNHPFFFPPRHSSDFRLCITPLKLRHIPQLVTRSLLSFPSCHHRQGSLRLPTLRPDPPLQFLRHRPLQLQIFPPLSLRDHPPHLPLKSAPRIHPTPHPKPNPTPHRKKP